MKRIARYSLFFLIPIMTLAPTTRSDAQIIDAIQQAIIAAIVAADVVVQQAQNATLDLQNAQKEIENQLSQLNLGQIGDWESQTKDLYSNYFSELWKVKDVISAFRQITGIISQQQQLVTEYKQAYARVQQDSHFSPAEVTYMYSVYSGIIAESVKSVDEILNVLTSLSLQMSDASRMRIINNASSNIQQQTSALRSFNNQAMQMSFQRAKDQSDLNTVKSLYGSPN
jgi:hypothetical protein